MAPPATIVPPMTAGQNHTRSVSGMVSIDMLGGGRAAGAGAAETRFVAGGALLSDLLVEVVRSPGFRSRASTADGAVVVDDTDLFSEQP